MSKAQILNKVREVVKMAKETYGFDVPYNALSITWNRGQAAGVAWSKGSRATGKRSYGLKFNLESASMNMTEMLEDTIPHEVAHIVCMANPTLGNGHNYGWANVCRGLGGTGNRTHSQVLSKAKYKTMYEYTLPSGRTATVSIVRHRKIQNGVQYFMRSPREQLSAECFTRVLTPEMHRQMHEAKVADYAAQQGNTDVSTTTKLPKSTRKTPKSTVKTPKMPKIGSKISICRGIFDPSASRADNIKKFMNTANCTKAGAATYYATIKKEQV